MIELTGYIPTSYSEIFGAAALVLHLIAYAIYAREVFHERVRPNVITWFMWLFGGVVELITYDAITGSSWSTNALPFACVIGIGGITFAIIIAQIRNMRFGTTYSYHKPIMSDYFLVLFDALAMVYWLAGGSAITANFIAVSTSIITFIPLWRTTYLHPDSEQHHPWTLWSLAYICMFIAVITSEGVDEPGLYFFPLYYLILHATMALLSLRTSESTK